MTGATKIPATPETVPDYAAMARALLDGTLTAQGFDHRAHVAVAYEILRRHEVFQAMALYAGGLRALTERAGVPEKFHATVTLIFLSTIAARMAGRDPDDVSVFLAENADLLDPGFLARHVDPAALATPLARQVPLARAAAG